MSLVKLLAVVAHHREGALEGTGGHTGLTLVR